jgi:hypothetical protein
MNGGAEKLLLGPRPSSPRRSSSSAALQSAGSTIERHTWMRGHLVKVIVPIRQVTPGGAFARSERVTTYHLETIRS